MNNILALLLQWTSIYFAYKWGRSAAQRTFWMALRDSDREYRFRAEAMSLEEQCAATDKEISIVRHYLGENEYNKSMSEAEERALKT